MHMVPRDDSSGDNEIDPELEKEINEHAQVAFGALENGPSRLAVQEFEWLVETWTELAGPFDDHTMVQRAWLAKALLADQRPEEAAEQQRVLVAHRTAVLGPDDHATLAMRGQLAQTLARGGNPTEAIELLRPLLDDRTRLFGADHPTVFDTLGNLGEALLLAKQSEEGVEVYTDLLARRTAALGEWHPDCLRTSLNLAAGRSQCCDDDAEALDILTKNLEHQAEGEGWESESVYVSRAHIAYFHRNRGNYEEAELMYASLHEDCTQVLGAEHPLTVQYERWLANIRAEIRNVQIAEESTSSDEWWEGGTDWEDSDEGAHWLMLDDLVRKVWGESFVALLERGAFDPESPAPTSPTPGVQDVRGFARLVASAVQTLHAKDAQDFRSGLVPISFFRTCDGFTDPGSSIEENWQVRQFAGSNGFDGWIPTDSDDTDYEFVCELLQVLAMIPSASWDQLTPARRICLAADLGELIRISIDTEEGALNGLAATVLLHVCAGDGALIDAAQIAGEALEHLWGERFFAIELNSIRSLSGRLRRA
jgi:tetratricopeptide (TPR) repeat protein